MQQIFKKVLKKGRRGWLGPVVIILLRQSPKNGKEIMDEIEKRTLGIWRPSPGSVYPALEELSKNGLIKKGRDGRYRLTEVGKRIVYPWEDRFYKKDYLDSIMTEIEGYIAYLGDVKSENEQEFNKYKERLKSLNKELGKLLA